LGVLHFLWLVKADIRQPATYGLVLVGLLGVRLILRRAGVQPSSSVRAVVVPRALQTKEVPAADY
ncbi:MAG: sulfoxide reductase heme-binding subunit YedZ, partial [Gemmatimonadetes bacterium]|nr:sulfoxide reductase heme-binding subunit YedZ [Gemmatimonadota bacterium]